MKTFIITVFFGTCVFSSALAQKTNALPDSAKSSSNNFIINSYFLFNKQPLYFVDNKEIKQEELSKINADDISLIEILKDTSATNMYGERAKFGVILIELKKEKNKYKPTQK
jgi:TonB-dependent SusC/RagA subfamily outer membrane receptor